MALYRSSMNMGAELCLPWRCGRGRWGKPRIERISRCISRRSWLRRRRWMKLECTSLSRLKSARAERSRSRGAQSATKLRGAAAQGERTCIAPALRATRAPGPRLRAPRRPRWRRGAGGRPRRSVTCCRRAPLRPRQTWPLPGRLRSARTPAPRSALAPGPLAPHSPGRTAGLGNRLEGASGRAGGRARRRARVGGAASRPGSRGASAGEAAGGGGRRAAGGRALLPPAPLALCPRAAATRALPNSGAGSRGPGPLPQPRAPWIAREAASGAPDWCAPGPGRRRRRTGFQGPLPRPRPPTCPRPRPPPSCAQWVHSFLLLRFTNIYRVPTGCPAPGRAPRGCGRGNPSRPWPLRARGRDREGGGQSDPWDSFWG
uniref:Uncharacterized protein n=1 Tax=Canis lupus familiaris TaxID=9615 RepID=A0A8I3QW40_CANLF